jgi:hypothetical protein
MRNLLNGAFAGLLLAFAIGTASAQDAPAGAILTITDGKESVEFDRDKLGAMKQEVVETSVPWLDDDADSKWPRGVARFSGPTFTDILNEVGFAGETVTATAADGYSIEIPRARLTGDGAILATGVNDAPLPADKAPHWIVFPYDQGPEINDEDHESWSVWKVTTLTVK